MAKMYPFSAYRPTESMVDKIAALPYDVYNRKEACEVVKKNPDSFLCIDRAETLLNDAVDTYDELVYKTAHDTLYRWIAEGKFVQEDKKVFYLYELIMDGRSQTGIVACASIDDYQNNVIKKHENTRADKEADRIHHVDTCNMQTGPIFLAYRQVDALRALMSHIKGEKPLYDFTSEDGITHRVWVVSEDADIASIVNAFASISDIYIADGHHRCASAVKVGLKRREAAGAEFDSDAEYNKFLSVLFPDEELMIMDYNRYVKDLNGLEEQEFLQKMQEKYEIIYKGEKQFKPAKKGEMGMLLGGLWYGLKALPQVMKADPVEGLDVSILQNEILSPVLGILDPKTDKRIDFIGGIRGLSELEKRCAEKVNKDCVAFAMYPTSIGELFAVADAGLLMPPKSTWFEPKLRSGIFLHELS